MDAKQVKEAHKLLGHIAELRKALASEQATVQTVEDWAQGCGVEPHRAAMLEAKGMAEAAARAILDVAATNEIHRLTQELKAMGVEVPEESTK